MRKSTVRQYWKRSCAIAGFAVTAVVLGIATTAIGKPSEKPRVLAQSEVIRAKDAKRSKSFEVNVTGLNTVMLKAEDVDGNSNDWIDWFDLVYVTAEGKKIPITAENIQSQSQGWGKFGINKAADGESPLKVEGKKVKGFGGHAPSTIVLDVPEGAVKLRATGALDDMGALTADKASVRFQIVNSDLGWMPDEELQVVDVSRFNVLEGLEVTLWAQSPMLFNPTNMDIDHKGRIWVAEAVNYRHAAGRRPEGDRIVVLEDTDGDGKADSSHTFVQDPSIAAPLGVSVFDNVVLVPQPPNLVKYTDVNRDLKFDPKVDKKEIMMTGFNAAQHDHSLHSVTAGPDGKWYFNNGNCGAIFTDKSGKTFRMNSVYRGGGHYFVDQHMLGGAASDDGYVWTSGFGVRMNPDGTNAEIFGHGYRNSYEQIVNSMGDIFQNDNDDYSACRNSYVLEYGSAGYFTRDGQRIWNTQQRPEEPVQSAHWRQRDPGTFEAGYVYSPGSPTGVTFYENGALGDKWAGTFLSGDAAQNVVFGFKPKARGAGFELTPMKFITTNLDQNYVGADATGKLDRIEDASDDNVLFRPSDVCVGPDGAIYVTDWYDGRVGGHSTIDNSCSGAIYRIAPKGFRPKVPEFDLNTAKGQITALLSPAVNVRYLGFERLKEGGEKSLPAVEKVLGHPNKWVAYRAVWLLPYLGEKGLERCELLLGSNNAEARLVAYRSLRRSGQNMLPYAKKLASDPDAAVRRDVALSLRPYSAEETAGIFVTLAKACDTNDKNSVEAIGLGAANKEDAVWKAIKASMVTGGADSWSDSFAKLTWRLWPVSAVADLKARALDGKLGKEQRMLAVESLAFIKDRSSADALLDIAAEDSSVKGWASFWLLRRGTGEWASMNLGQELKERGIYDPDNIQLSPVIVPPATPKEKLIKVEDVMRLRGDKKKGAQTIMRCVMCHNINGNGPDYGPALKGWGATQSREAVIRSIVAPSADIAHGFKGQEITLRDGQKIHGLVTSNADPHIITSTGGVTQLVPNSRIKEVKWMDRSLMMSADQLGLNAQDVADIVEYLQSWK